ncbi:MAG: hypothetical protein DHS20C16_30640 [Phycisphaerae bacterium]|nr:MAG: hypothetical protein DHS20C16_30640 [Phycisphaerae bacterium]
MLRHRQIILAISILVVVGSISTAIGYAVYIRSDSYRHSVEQQVGDYLNLRTTINRVTPLSGSSRKFSGIEIFLPEIEKPTFGCTDAIWHLGAGDSGEQVALDLNSGILVLDSNALGPDEYRRMLASGLGHDFQALGLASVQLNGFDIAWKRNGIGLVIQGAEGDIRFSPDGTGHANLTAKRFNGSDLTAPLQVDALFTPGAGLEFHHVSLDVPPVPVGVLGLGRFLRGDINSGWFNGAITLRDDSEAQRITIRGALGDIRLEELASSMLDQPVRGRVDIMLDEAVVANRELETMTFRGSLSDVRLEDIASIAKVPGLTGLVNLRVQQARIVGQEIAHASVVGDAASIPLEAITKLIGHGVVTGELRVKINGLLVENNEVKWADISADAIGKPGEPGTISRDMILSVAKDVLGVDLGRLASMLPETIEYVDFGVKVLVDRGRLRFEGSHGDDGMSVLTIRDPILGQPISVFSAPKMTYRLDDLIDEVRERLEQYELEDVQDWLKSKSRAEASK